MNPGSSSEIIGVFPNCLTMLTASSNLAGEVLSVLTISTSLVACAGLKKCNPRTLSFSLTFSAILARLSVDVFDASVADEEAASSICWKSLCFRSVFVNGLDHQSRFLARFLQIFCHAEVSQCRGGLRFCEFSARYGGLDTVGTILYLLDSRLQHVYVFVCDDYLVAVL